MTDRRRNLFILLLVAGLLVGSAIVVVTTRSVTPSAANAFKSSRPNAAYVPRNIGWRAAVNSRVLGIVSEVASTMGSMRDGPAAS